MTGEVVALYAYDVANEILLGRVTRVLDQVPTRLDVRRDHTSPRDFPLHQPLAVEPAVAFTANGLPARVQVRVFEAGVVSVVVRLAVDQPNLEGLAPFHRLALVDGRELEQGAREVCDLVVRDLGSAIVKPAPPTAPEAYTVFCLADLGGARDVPAWLDQNAAPVAGLLADMPSERLADSQVAETLRYQRSFEKSDLVVVDWDAALVVDLDGYFDDVLYILELANLQLEEFRVLDTALDRHLTFAYDLAERRPSFRIGLPNRALRHLRGLSVDLAKLADEVTHITKFLGDWHLARVYLLARERFHLDQWRASIEGRLKQLDDLFSVVRGEVNERRMLWLEVIIVVFFAIDLLAILVLRK